MSSIVLYHQLNKPYGYKGFEFRFSNGVIASVQFGNGEQCTPVKESDDHGTSFALNAEVAALKDGKFITHFVVPDMIRDDPEVISYCEPYDIVIFLERCREYYEK